MKYYFYTLITFLIFHACEPTKKNNSENEAKAEEVKSDSMAPKKDALAPPPFSFSYQFPYDLKSPSETFKLSRKLEEISGLSLSPNGKHIIAVNDEEGKIFFLDKKDGEIKETVKFGKSGDYEGIEAVDDKIYVVKNNGDIFRVKDFNKKDPKTKEYETDLNSNYDVEGLGYDKAKNRLLLACKGKAGKDKGLKGKRAVYGFDLEEKKLSKDPVYVVDRDMIGAYFKSDGISQQLVDFLTPQHASDAFAPSGIAINPQTSDICIISSVGKLFLILSPTGQIKYMEKLDASIFRQPEGICFDKEGTLYMSSEGRGGKGRLFKFHPN